VQNTDLTVQVHTLSREMQRLTMDLHDGLLSASREVSQGKVS